MTRTRQTFTVRDPLRAQPQFEVSTQFGEGDLESLDRQGYLFRDGFLSQELTRRLAEAAHELELQEKTRPTAGSFSNHNDFGGQFIRLCQDKHPAFLELAQHPELVGLAKVMMGPLVKIRDCTLRIVNSDLGGAQDTVWHQHLRVIPTPLPMWFCVPQALDCLLYLDGLTEESGSVAVIPESHRNLQFSGPTDIRSAADDQLVLTGGPGSLVTIHANLWHRGLPPSKQGIKRRLIILSYCPTWMQAAEFAAPAEDGLIRKTIEQAKRPDATPEERAMLELVGGGLVT
jgi:ectoine hydroxylase-related dioxygenase (phytanoyl-CoA dioxygenase family)